MITTMVALFSFSLGFIMPSSPNPDKNTQSLNCDAYRVKTFDSKAKDPGHPLPN
ncbi:hypothetical protein PR003_g17106 [Phytophthora rubi]|uniref:RxLR effector protein n=1 Tax=Phytophthora rubi TaxID=129364 RepID=A0A6A4ETC8_9STRA|nr:hypothetical protein PR002_g5203 [Phytophthora rubi]KAE9045366.1 hypothetical protein PR001_g4994 [Phytophthora rubi]KAE9322924.1 hypothetical protein PR003_g17106 [Phytophthora rubi]